MNDRTCIVTRQTGPAEALLRFVAAPDGTIAFDQKRKLPGRGCHVLNDQNALEQAIKKNLFARALKRPVTIPNDLLEQIDIIMAKGLLGALGLARKSGDLALGASQTEKLIRSGKAALVLHAPEAAIDGVHKLTKARKAVALSDGPKMPAFAFFNSDEMGLAFGAQSVIHAGLSIGGAAKGLLARSLQLATFRGLPDPYGFEIGTNQMTADGRVKENLADISQTTNSADERQTTNMAINRHEANEAETRQGKTDTV